MLRLKSHWYDSKKSKSMTQRFATACKAKVSTFQFPTNVALQSISMRLALIL